eukprot:9592467-Lingulodinium_polyedra.AAC.1
MVVDTRSACIAKCAAPQQWNAFLIAFMSSSRAGAAHTRAQKRISLLRRRTFRDSRTACVDHHVAVNAWSA